ncbi:MAG: ParB N-terminal domain-containing protein [Clostridia bacterium]|nr:ParB N-terminal domain-containing protein [Clostridia bacterium]
MEVIRIPLNELTPDPANAKDHPAEQVEQIKRSIEQFGNLDPIGVWGPENLIVEGHGRFLALRELGETEAECIRLDRLTDEERRAYSLVHNKLTMNSGFIPEALDLSLESIGEIDMSDFGFGGLNEWFRTGDKGEAEEGEEEYSEFLEKFEAKHTTDDCYTPVKVYDAVAGWVEKEYGVSRKKFVRPFYPGGDYQKEKYKKGDIVVDNPPFSIMSEIINFYMETGQPFFLFAPCMALFNYLTREGVCAVCVQSSVIYENGAVVPTSFLTNLDTCRARTASELFKAIKQAVDEIKAESRKEVPKYIYPDFVATAAMLGKFSKYGVDMKISNEDSVTISELDAMKEQGKAIYGKGLLLSEKAAAEKAAAEKAAATRWQLSDREKAIVKSLGGE